MSYILFFTIKRAIMAVDKIEMSFLFKFLKLYVILILPFFGWNCAWNLWKLSFCKIFDILQLWKWWESCRQGRGGGAPSVPLTRVYFWAWAALPVKVIWYVAYKGSSRDVIAISIVEGRKVSGRFCGAMSFARSHLSLCQMITDPKKSISSRELWIGTDLCMSGGVIQASEWVSNNWRKLPLWLFLVSGNESQFSELCNISNLIYIY